MIGNLVGFMRPVEDQPNAVGYVKRAEHSEEPFHPTACRITIKSIKKPELPEANDTLAQKVGLKTWSELEERIVADLE